MRSVVLICHNIRSVHNIGSLLRTCEGLGVECVYLTGYSPYPIQPNDRRLPHQAEKTTRQLSKTALGAETLQPTKQADDLSAAISELKKQGCQIIALEQHTSAIDIAKFKPEAKLAVLIGNEVDGLDEETLELVDQVVEIPMQGKKESFNVAQAGAMALYNFAFLK